MKTIKKWITNIFNRFGYYNEIQIPERYMKIIKHKPSWSDPKLNNLFIDKITEDNFEDLEFDYDIRDYNLASLSANAKEKIVAVIKEDEIHRANKFSSIMDDIKNQIDWDE